MFMPKAAIHKNDCFVFRQHNVRTARKISNILSITKALGEQVLPHFLLGLRIFAADVRHIHAADFFAVIVSHDSSPSFIHKGTIF